MTNFNTVMPLVAGILFIAVALYRWCVVRHNSAFTEFVGARPTSHLHCVVDAVFFVMLVLNLSWLLFRFIARNPMPSLRTKVESWLDHVFINCPFMFTFVHLPEADSRSTYFQVWFMTEEERAAERAALDSVPQATRISMSDLSSVLSPLQSYDSGFSARFVQLHAQQVWDTL